MFSMMARMKRKWSADESWLDLKKRKVRMGRYLVQKHSILLSDRLLSKVFSWAGHVARMSLDKWTLRFTLWSGCCWKQDGKHNPAWNNYDVQHRYALIGTRNRKELFWENIIFDFFDKKNKIWWVEAQNKENWRRWAPEFKTHYSLEVWDDDPFGLTPQDLLQIDFGERWNEYDAQHLMDFFLPSGS